MGPLFIYFVVTQLTMINVDGEAIFRREKGKYLNGNVIKTVYAESEFDCRLFCARDGSCASVNYKISGENRGSCELTTALLSDGNGVEKPEFNNLEIVHRKCEKSYQQFSKKSKTCVAIHLNSCKELLSHNPSTPNGKHYLQADGTMEPYQVYCHMDEISGCGGGGWTLVMKMNGSKDTFGYNSPYWSDTRSYNVQDGLDGLTDKESKLEAFWKTSFSKICLGMKIEGEQQIRWLTVPQEAPSLHSLFGDGKFLQTNLGRGAWKSLISNSSLQLNCNKEGVNVDIFTEELIQMKLRIGIVANNENYCGTCDSFVGFGAYFLGCDTTSPITTGNFATCPETDNGRKITPAIGFILVH